MPTADFAVAMVAVFLLGVIGYVSARVEEGPRRRGAGKDHPAHAQPSK